MSRNDVLVDAEWLLSNLGRPDVVVLEVDEDVTVYDDGHIAGAVRIDWRKDLQDPVRRDLIGPVAFAELLGRHGISPDTMIVLYGGNNNWFATYAYWYLKLYGHKNVAILDGGRKLWELDDRPMTTEVIERTPVVYPVPDEDGSLRARRDAVVELIGTADLLDARSPDEYAGRLLAPAHLPQEHSQRAGHVPTAVNIPWSQTANDDGTFRSDDDLRAIYDGNGITGDNTVVTYCRIGERAAHTWFVLHELLDYPDVRNYDGSWTEYGSLIGVPVQLGDTPGTSVGGTS
jgi:thiosulfate/3-mercaptopyruvate sulfurtransferase